MRCLLIVLLEIGCAHQARPNRSVDPSPAPLVHRVPFSDGTLPSPPVDLKAISRAHYEKAAQDYAAGFYAEAEEGMRKSYKYHADYVIWFNIAMIHKKQKQYDDAAWDLVMYFTEAPFGKQSQETAKAHARAKQQLTEISQLKGNSEFAGRALTRDVVTDIKAGHYAGVTTKLDNAFYQTYDLSLMYWIVLLDFKLTKKGICKTCMFKEMPLSYLKSTRALLNAYFFADDQSEKANAQRLYDEIDTQYRKQLAKEIAHGKNASANVRP